MQLKLNKTELAGALVALGKLVCRSSPIPVYRTVQIEAVNNTLFFRTHNADEEIEFRTIICQGQGRILLQFSTIIFS